MPDQTLSDQIVLSDDSGQLGLGLIFSEKLNLFDAGNLGTNEIARILYTDLFQFQDNANFSLNTIGIIGIGFSLSDNFTIADSLYISTGFLFKDNLTFLDYLILTLPSNYRNIYDTFNFVESIQYLNTIITATNDSNSLSDSIGLSQIFPSLDSVNLLDSVGVAIGNLIITTNISVTDTNTLFDSIQFCALNTKVLVGDSFAFQDFCGSMPVTVTDSYLRRYLNDII